MSKIDLKKMKWATPDMEQPQAKRCAIYTRKSIEEGLDAAYTTLDAQRDYCETYIRQHADKGWEALPEHYDDGGFSGKNMERPAMQRLLQDVADHKVDIVVAYKIDRFSRSLVDFANFSTFLEQNGASFVVVTEHVDTTTPAGRMQINLLMIFAQYEREMIATRIKDKMTAMRKHGLWTGGPVPYGYRSVDKKLVVCKEEKAVVVRIFKRYAEIGSPLVIARELSAKSVPPPRKEWSTSVINKMLRNQVYLGKMKCGDEYMDGVHEAIISDELWKKAECIRKIRTPRLLGKSDTGAVALFKGSIICGECGRNMIINATCKESGTRNAYYKCNSGVRNGLRGERCRTHNLPIGEVDREVMHVALSELSTPEAFAALRRLVPTAIEKDIKGAFADVDYFLGRLNVVKRCTLAQVLVKKVTVYETTATIILNGAVYSENGEDIVKNIPLRVVRCSSSVSLALGQRMTDVALPKESIDILAAIYTGREWMGWLREGRVHSLYELTKQLGMDKSFVRRRLRLSMISPRIIVALLNHNENLNVSLSKLQKNFHLPWPQQEAAVGLLV